MLCGVLLALASTDASAAGEAAAPRVSVGSFTPPSRAEEPTSESALQAKPLGIGPVSAPVRKAQNELKGLYYFRARYYDPYAGRFLQRDPIYDPANLGNQYTYAANNPVNYLDPMGTDVTMSAGDAAAMGNIFGAGNVTTRPAPNGQVTVGFSDSQAAAKASYDFVQRTKGDMAFRMKMWKALNASRTTTMADVRGQNQTPERFEIDHSQDQEGVSRKDPLRMYGVPRSWVPVPGCPGQYQDYTLTHEYAMQRTLQQAESVARYAIIAAALMAIPGPFDEAAAAGGIARVGVGRAGVTEVRLSSLRPLHSVPRPGVPPGHIGNLATKIRTEGYKLDQAIPVIRMPDGRMVHAGGHHRAAAMRQLGETTIPARVKDWSSLSPRVQEHYRQTWPGKFD